MNLSAINLLFYFGGTTLVCFICLFLSFMLYLHYIHNINRHLPGPPRSSFILGNLPQLWQYKKETGRTLIEFLLKYRLEYGPVFVIFYLHRAVVYLGDQRYITDVFLNNHKYLIKPAIVYHEVGFIFGERGMGYGLLTNTNELLWRKRRQLMNAAFHRKCLRNFLTNFNEVSDRFMTRMDLVADSGKPTSMLDEFQKVTLEVISQVLFNINTNTIEDPESPFLFAIRNYVKGMHANLMSPLPAFLTKILRFRPFRNSIRNVQINAVRFLRNFASECIAARLKDIVEGNDVPNDFLSLLITDGSLTKEEIIDEFITMIIAGHETTASSLAFALFEIISNGQIEAKLSKEIEEVLGNNEEITFDDLAKLKYVGQIFDESHRKHPVAVTPLRTLQKTTTVGGYQIPKGNGVGTLTFFFDESRILVRTRNF